MENNTLCNRHSLGVNNHTKMYVTYTRIYGWSDYGGESSYQPGYRLENMMWMTLLVYDYIIPGEIMNYLKSVIPIIEANYKNFTSVEKNIANFFRNNEEIMDFLQKVFPIDYLFQRLLCLDLQKNVVTEGIENLFINMSRI